MNWKRDTTNSAHVGNSYIPEPPKLEYEMMLDVLKNAEYYSSKQNNELEISTLLQLNDYILKYIDKNDE